MYGRGWRWRWRARGWGGWRGYYPSYSGYRYIGPCRCGFGPDAFYEEISTGRIVHASELWRGGPIEDVQSEVKRLKAEKEEIERRIEELEKRLEESGTAEP